MREVILGANGMVGAALARAIPDAVRDPDKPKTNPMVKWDYRMSKGPERLCAGVDVLYLCAARVGGIQRNIDQPGSMIYDNLMIQANVIEAARLAGVKLIVFLGSSCIYPAHIESAGDLNGKYSGPLSESDIMAGPLEPTNEPYAIAKIAGIKMLEAYKRQYGMEYLAVMPCNLYGPGDNFDPQSSHFIPGMIRKFHDAKIAHAPSVTLWGTGTPRRETMHVDDCARIIVELVRKGARGMVNIGPGVDLPIRDLALRIASAVGFSGEIEWDRAKPDGVMRKLLDVSRMESFGVELAIDSYNGIRATYEWFLKNEGK